LASEADFIFATEVLKRGGKLIPVLPFDKDEYLKYFNSHDRESFESLLDLSEEPIVISNSIPKELSDSHLAYLEAGKYIACNSECLIAIWDGQDAKGKSGKGGTGDIVDYYKKRDGR